MEKNNMIKKVLDIIKDSAIFLLLFIVINILLTSVMFLVNISITKINVILSTLLTIGTIIFIYRKKDKKSVIISACLAVLVILIALFFASYTYDKTWDGNTYHKLAIGMLKDGWNPVYETAEEYIKNDAMNIGIKDDERNSIWIEHYPKASWVFSANIYSVTGNIESAKIITMLMMYIAFSIILNYMYKKVNFIFSFLIAILTVVNPITVVQVFSYYIDGLMGLCIYIILCALLALSDKKACKEENNKNFERENWFVLALSIIVCINLKFTGLVYAGIFCIMFFVFWLIRAYKEGMFKERLIKYLIYYVTVVLISVCIVGFSSYVKNLFVKGNPLYPLMGENKVDIMTYNEPKSFPERGAVDKFFTSMFAVSENVKSNSTDKDPTLKFPFVIKKSEIKQFTKPDTRMAGFGVWFSGIFIISIISLGYLIYLITKDKEYEKLGLLLAFIAVSILLVLITDGSWWARYVPYIYLLPIIAVLLLAQRKEKINKILASFICVLLTINITFICVASFGASLVTSIKVEKELKVMRQIEQKDGKVNIALETDGFYSILYNMRDKNIKVEVKELEELRKTNSTKYVNYFYYENTLEKKEQ